jgi:hypothetical protein
MSHLIETVGHPRAGFGSEAHANLLFRWCGHTHEKNTPAAVVHYLFDVVSVANGVQAPGLCWAQTLAPRVANLPPVRAGTDLSNEGI